MSNLLSLVQRDFWHTQTLHAEVPFAPRTFWANEASTLTTLRQAASIHSAVHSFALHERDGGQPREWQLCCPVELFLLKFCGRKSARLLCCLDAASNPLGKCQQRVRENANS